VESESHEGPQQVPHERHDMNLETLHAHCSRQTTTKLDLSEPPSVRSRHTIDSVPDSQFPRSEPVEAILD
jgi:hypothetical protein